MFLYPPRPEHPIMPSMIPSFEQRGFVAQIKKNGTCSIVNVDAKGACRFYTRHGDTHKAWTPSTETKNYLSKFKDSTFVFELLHSKGGGVRDTLYFFDVLALKGEDMVGVTFTARMEELRKALVLAPANMSVAEVYTSGLSFLFSSLVDPLDEGLVLKDPKSVLRSCFQEGKNSHWQVKCRRPTKNYGF